MVHRGIAHITRQSTWSNWLCLRECAQTGKSSGRIEALVADEVARQRAHRSASRLGVRAREPIDIHNESVE